MKLLGFAPDADPTILGVLTNCSAVIPTLKGFKSAPTAASTGFSAAGTVQGAATLYKLDLTTRFFVGTGKSLYEFNSSGSTNIGRASTYTPTAVMRWRFAQFGNVSLASNANDTIQASTGASFADISGAPKADIIETVGQFVLAFNTTDATNGNQQDRWYCCGIGDYTNWTPSIAAQCATGRLTSAPGPIVAAKKFGSACVAFKRNAAFLGQYVGPPVVWDWQQINGIAGCMSQESVVDVGTPENPKLVWMGPDNFWSYDGSKPVPIGTNRVKETVFNQLIQSRAYTCLAHHDRINSIVRFWYPSSDALWPDKCVVYNYRTDTWGQDDRQIQFVFDYVSPGISYDAIGTYYTTYDSLTSNPYDLAFLSSSLAVPGVIDTSNNISTLTGGPTTSSITTGDLGDDETVTTIHRLRPRWLTAPTAATMTNYYKMNEGDSLTQDVTTTQASGKFDLLRSARWHRLQLNMTGSWEVAELPFVIDKDGNE